MCVVCVCECLRVCACVSVCECTMRVFVCVFVSAYNARVCECDRVFICVYSGAVYVSMSVFLG